jgi:anti-anti-sigma factor
MDVKWERKDETAVAVVEGRIDGANFWEFQNALESGLDPEAQSVILDFEQVAFMSSAGLRVVLMLGKQLRKRGAQLAVCSLSSAIRRIFTVSGFDRIVPVHGSETQAIDALTSAPEPSKADAETLRSEIDFDIVGDNLKDIAGFTLEKHEFINDCTLSQETRQEALTRINEALWQCVEQSKRERLVLLQRMFAAAADALEKTVGPTDH